MRKPQKAAEKGSKKWIQCLVNDKTDILNNKINEKFECLDIKWVSPIKRDKYAEYRDNDFLKRLGLKTLPRLSCFWPRNGPQWDALAKCSDGTIIIVEAKSHLNELKSKTKAKSESSIFMINEAFKLTKQHYHVDENIDWTNEYYQYANRIATLFYLNEICKKPRVSARLIFLYFANDTTLTSNLSVNKWEEAIKEVKKQLGLPEKISNTADIILDVTSI